jgi:hypothetical protein
MYHRGEILDDAFERATEPGVEVVDFLDDKHD